MTQSEDKNMTAQIPGLRPQKYLKIPVALVLSEVISISVVFCTPFLKMSYHEAVICSLIVFGRKKQ